MNGRFSLGRLFGTDIYASLGFFLLLGYFFYVGGSSPGAAAVFCGAIVVSLLVHEFGHVFAYRWLLGAPCIVLLWFLGGLCIPDPEQVRGTQGDHKKQIAISVMGPVFGFALAGVAYAAYKLAPPLHPAADRFLWVLVVINVFLNALNLLPIWPLDGGQALRAALALRLSPSRAFSVTRRVSIATAGLGIVAGVHFGWTLAVLLAAMLLIENLNSRSLPHE